ncbi:MAG: hypothetical protein Q9160_006897 [Pyrenula sp. 1 TL-2023]
MESIPLATNISPNAGQSGNGNEQIANRFNVSSNSYPVRIRVEYFTNINNELRDWLFPAVSNESISGIWNEFGLIVHISSSYTQNDDPSQNVGRRAVYYK